MMSWSPMGTTPCAVVRGSCDAFYVGLLRYDSMVCLAGHAWRNVLEADVTAPSIFHEPLCAVKFPRPLVEDSAPCPSGL